MHTLSFGQQRLWFLDQLDGPSATYNVPFPLRLIGRLDRGALREALADLLDRHEVLRTVIPVEGGVPSQHVLTGHAATALLPFELVEVGEDLLPAALATAAGRPFELAAELPVRITLFRVDGEHHVLLVLLHHIACDGWSLAPLARDLGTAYAARLAGSAPGWEALPVQYRDFAEWQREVLGSEDDPDSLMSAQLAYWTQRLDGIPERLSLAGRRHPVESTEAARRAGLVELEFPAQLHARLIQSSRTARCTPFMVLQAGVAALLHRCGGGPDIVLGTPVTGRTDEVLADLIGFFVNTLVLRTDLSGDPSFGQLLDRVRASNLAAYTHQDVPFDRLVERMVGDREAAAHPLYQVMLVLQHGAGAELALPGLQVQPVALDIATAKLDLSVVFSERYAAGKPAGIGCQLEYATDLFDEATVIAMGELLVRLLDAALTAPAVPLSSLPIDSPVLPGAIDSEAVTLLGAESVPPGTPAETAVRSGRPPRDAREQILCGLFADVLGVENVGVDDGFFALGGHSLLATQLISKIRATLRVELGIRQLFRAPTVTGILATIDKRVTGRLRPALRPRPRPAELPLSYAQQRLWFLSGLAGQERAYNIPLTLELSGQVDHAALAAACRDVVIRHETLRTVFPVTDGQPRQQVLMPAEVGSVLTVVECAPGELTSLTEQAGTEPFALDTDLPLRARLFVVRPEESVLVLCLHHIAADGESLAPLLRDLAVAYRARLAGTTPSWPDLAVHYADYTLWQRDLLGDETDPHSMISAQLAFWREALAGLPDELSLPVDRPRPAVSSHRLDQVTAEVDPEVCAALARVARVHQVTLFMVVQAALAVVLARSGAGEDVPIGTPVAGRSDEALDELVGFFVNTLVLRTDVSGSPSFAELLGRVREVDLGAYVHQDVPFERLVEELNPVRASGRHPLFQVLLSFLTTGAEGPGWQLPGVSVRAQDTVSGAPKFDLSLTVEQRPAGLGCTFEYAADLFDRSTVTELAHGLIAVFAAVAADPGIQVDRLQLLGAEERRRVLVDFNATDAPRVESTLPRLFADQVARTPDAVAVVFEGRSWTYAQFSAQVQMLACGLVASGVLPGDVVAVSLPRGVELAAAVYAVQRAGAAYLPVDPDYPVDRVAFMLSDAAPRLVLTEQTLATVQRAGTGDEVLPVLQPGSSAYLIYTSGSTGRPKGVLMSHGAIVNHLSWLQGEYPLTADDRVVVKAPISFDTSVSELFWPLLAGASQVIARPGGHRDPAYLAELITAQRVTSADFVPSMLEAFLSLPTAAACTSLRQLFAGGEALTAALAARCAAMLPARLSNLYGPTEVAIEATHHRYEQPAGPVRTVPIGRPVWNSRAYVLDARLQPVRVGVPGELYLAGIQLADGYLYRAGLTAERFLADPFGAPGQRMYRTGDLARWSSDGLIDYLGRTDDQVKLRGQRIELGEIVAVALEYPGVREAVVLLREDRPGDQRLVAYLVGDVAVDDLRAHLTKSLPAPLVPSGYVVLQFLPLTPSGKLDRKALPVPTLAAVPAGRPARDAREELLCGIFAELLGVDSVGIDDGFFDLGGHSLLATRLISRVRAAFDAELGIADLFDAPTVAGLVQRLDTAGARGDEFSTLLPLRRTGGRPPLFCVHPAAGLSWMYSGLLGYLEPDRPMYGLQSRGLAEPDRQPGTFAELVKDYLEQIRQVQPSGPYHLIGWSFGAQVIQAMAAQLAQDGERVGLVAMLDGYPPDSHRPAPETERELLIELLLSLGHDLSELPHTAPLGPAEFADRLRTADSPLAALSPAAMAALPPVFRRNVELSSGYQPGCFPGAVLFVEATEGRNPGGPCPESWAGYLPGELTVLPVPVQHGQLTNPAAWAQFGPELASRLAAAD
ncbi:amino acid adenylation domain-containing protein [Jatrophihabitans sp.]|uniref:amino acid adenylation domain-containing protein n=1 Tax=Jatrophihabitans sp. TaxID=1932789 RepID=UPI002F0861EE